MFVRARTVAVLVLFSCLFPGVFLAPAAWGDNLPPPVQVKPGVMAFDVQRDLRYWKEEGGRPDIQEVVGRLDLLDWVSPAAGPPIGRTTDVYWMVLRLENIASHAQKIALRFVQHRAHRVDAWVLRDRQLQAHYQGGLTAPLSSDLFSRRLTLPVNTESGHSYTILLRIDSREYLYFNHFRLEPFADYPLYVHARGIEIGIFIGVALSMAILNLMLWLHLREKSYLVFFLWICCMSLHLLTFYGEGARHLLTAFAWIIPHVSFFCHSAANVLMLVFAMIFLETREHSPGLHRILLGFVLVQAGAFVFFLGRPLAVGMNFTELLAALAIPFMLAAGILAWSRRHSVVRYYVIATAILSAYAITLWVCALFFPQHIIPVADQMLNITTSQMFLISMAQMDRLYRLKRQKDQAVVSSNTDELTQLPNRRAFDLALDAALERCVGEQGPLSLLLLDVDYFKRYNDELGHPAGDKCLQQVAAILQGGLSRPYDIVARYGGEEFAVILPGADSEVAQRVAASLQRALAEHALPHPDSPIAKSLTLSVGIATAWPDETTRPGTLVKYADEQLYAAKADGRNCFRAVQSSA